MKKTPFTKSTLINSGGWLAWGALGTATPHAERRFVARFKGRGGGGVKSFMTHLCRHHTVEEYFAAMDAGDTPLAIAKRTGYLLPHIKRWLKKDGYPQTPAGYEAWKARETARWDAFYAAKEV